MKKLFLSIVFLLLPVLSKAAYTFTTTQDGPWETGATWIGGVAPTTITEGSATIKIAHAVTIDPTATSTIGTSGVGHGVVRIDINGAGASLSLANTSASLSIVFNSTGTDPIGSGLSPSGGIAGGFDPGINATMNGMLVAGGGTLNLTGTAVHPVTITTQNDSSPCYIWGGWQILATFVGATITLQNCILKHLGKNDDAGSLIFYGISFDGRGSGAVDIENCEFIDPYKGFHYYASGTDIFTGKNNWFSGAVRGNYGFDMNTSMTGNTYTISGNTWDNPSYAGAYICIRVAGSSATVTNNTCYNSTTNGYTMVNLQNASSSTFSGNALFQSTNATGGAVYANTAVASIGNIITQSVGTYIGNVLQAEGGTACSYLYGKQNTNQASAGQGVIAIGYSGTHTFTNCVGVTSDGNGQGFMPYDAFGTNGQQASFTVDHCTIFGTGTSGTAGMMFSDGGVFPAIRSRCRSSLFVGLNVGVTDPLNPAFSFGAVGSTMTTDGSGNANPQNWTPTSADIGLWVQITATSGGWTNNALYKITGASGGTWQMTPLGTSPSVPLSATDGHYNFWGISQFTIDTPPNAGVHHNATYGNTNSYSAVNNSFGSPGFTDGANIHPSSTYGDIDGQNPNFVDTTRTELAWNSFNTYPNLMAAFANRSGMTGSSFNTSVTVNNLVTYLFNGFAPQNTALRGVSYGGGDMGAVSVFSPTSTNGAALLMGH